MKHFAVGVDFGGTNIRAGVVDRRGQVYSLVRVATRAEEDVTRVIRRIAEAVLRSIAASPADPSNISGVVIAACGLVDRPSGTFVCSSVLPTWQDVQLAETLGCAVGLPVQLENDANAALSAEVFVGVAAGARNVVGMTLGTGIGGAAILNGRLFRGTNGLAAEFGHIAVDPNGPECFCGNKGCLGLLASATAMVEQYKTEFRTTAARGNDERQHTAHVDAETIHRLGQAGDSAARRVITNVARYLGIGTATVLSCFNPEMVVFTGGLTRMGSGFLQAISAEARGRTYPPIFSACDLQFGSLGDACGVIGAARLLLDGDDTASQAIA